MDNNRRRFLASLLPAAALMSLGKPGSAQEHLVDTRGWAASVAESEKTTSGKTIKALLEENTELSRLINLSLNDFNREAKKPFLASDFPEGDHHLAFEKFMLLSSFIHNTLSDGKRLETLSENTQKFLTRFARILCESIPYIYMENERRSLRQGIVPKRSWVDPNCESKTILVFMETGTVVAMGGNRELENTKKKKKKMGPYEGGILHDGKSLPHSPEELYSMANQKYICAVGFNR